MTNCTKNSYIEVLRQFLILNQQLNPLSILIDFEQPFISAFGEIFPNATNGLQKKYGENSLFALQIKHLCALDFIPVQDVASAFEKLLNSQYFVDNEEVLQPIIDYFEETWIGCTVRRKRKNPMFPLKMLFWLNNNFFKFEFDLANTD
ncbi:Uncharacterized protein FWK35_00014982 [Aphis craccivora]|uniref:MULE domain-containing protein n=1 Tax=Aphis craccivora TaxID=307492 RepID=A0A6G0Y7I3_APHCR|nr:Uncharacterized protein FWK35_00014982 [Aphis craccivora]